MADVKSMVYYLGENTLRKLWNEIKTRFVPKTIKINGQTLNKDINITTHAEVLIDYERWQNQSDGFTKPFTVNCPAVEVGDDVLVFPAPDSNQRWYDANVRCSDQGDGTLTFETDSTLTEDLTANILILKGVVHQ